MVFMKRILIADRGEVALRILRTAREMGIETIAVYSEQDSSMEYLKWADKTVRIGPPQPAKSYFNVDAIMSVAINWKANAIHPGYGFLSESPVLASRCEENGIAFIGPPSTVLRTIGNKSRTKEVAKSLDIPTIPGSYGPVSDRNSILSVSRILGMPVIIKSLYGGGGRGMKVAYNEEQLFARFASVSSEANAAFGRSDVYLEHYIPSPRHLEVQVLSDDYGHIKILGDRECSIQRRHQKVIEEAPIPNIDEGIRNNMWAWSKKIMNSIDFQGLGTVEFLMDQEGDVFFLEINGRLQVEHPVTEMITGIDMVREQILVAAGANIDTTPLSITGHAIECRINAENPSKNFMPTTGVVRKLRLPGGPGVRVDTHLFVGCEVSSFYDPLLAKLISFDSTRTLAISRMSRMLDETITEGILTNKDFLGNILRNKHFLDAKGDTSLVTQVLGE